MNYRNYKKTSQKSRFKNFKGGTKKTPKTISSKPSFAQRLGAFLLESVKGKIYFSEKTGFSDKHIGIFGVLPFLHMNIQEETFRDMLNNSNGSLKEVLNNKCQEKNLDDVLQKVDYHCDLQCDAAIEAVCTSIMDSINNRYKMRKNGQKRLAEMYGFMSWQVVNDKIPKTSIEWAKK